MPSLFDTFRFTANDGSGDQSLTPIARGLKRRWERIDGGRAYRVKLSNKLLFKGADYTYFRDIYDAGDCTEVSLLIENYCGGEWVTWHEGIVPIFQGEYNASRCEVSFEIKPNDVYQCADKSLSSRTNWLEYGTPTDIRTFIQGGTIETYSVTVIVPSVLTSMKWAFTILDIRDNADPDATTQFRPITNAMVITLSQTKIITTLARETVTSVGSPGTGWVNISGTTWARPVILGKIDIQGIFKWEAQIINPAPISNGRKLSDVLTEAVAELDCDIDEVVSNFLNINPDATNPSNDAYDYASDNFTDIFFFQKSDIVRAGVSNDATRFTFSVKEFLDEMKIFNLFWAITSAGGTNTLRIEHYTYFDGSNGLDLTTLQSGRFIEGLDSFKSEVEVPNFESFAYQESYRSKFLVKRITYPPACATTQGDERTSVQMCADFSGLLENQDAGLEGFFLLATYDLGGGEYLMNALSAEANGAFAWENILPALWADGRFHADATANVPGYTVNSVAKMREQVQITIPFCCDDEFEPSELVQTQLGWGEVKSAEQDTERGTLKLTLLQ